MRERLKWYPCVRGSSDIHACVRGSSDVQACVRGSSDIHACVRGSSDVHACVRGSSADLEEVEGDHDAAARLLDQRAHHCRGTHPLSGCILFFLCYLLMIGLLYKATSIIHSMHACTQACMRPHSHSLFLLAFTLAFIHALLYSCFHMFTNSFAHLFIRPSFL